MSNNKGITLIALVVTIIVIFILAGVTVNLTLNGKTGLFPKAKLANQKTVLGKYADDLVLEVGKVTIDDRVKSDNVSYYNKIEDDIEKLDWVSTISNADSNEEIYNKTSNQNIPDDGEARENQEVSDGITPESEISVINLKIQTKEGYKITVKIDNVEKKTEIVDKSLE